jgi:hypothetical protein
MSGENRDGSKTPSGEENQGQDNFLEPEVAKKCLEITQQYRASDITKVSAILQLQETIPHVEDNEDAFISALASYISILDNFEQFRTRAAQRRNDGDGTGGLGDRQDDVAQGAADRANKRPRSPGSDRDDNDAATKRKADVKAFAWVIQDEIDPPSLSTELKLTQSALENFSRDPKVAKASLLYSARCPQFPDSEWTNLLAGRSVDLDHVFSGQYSVTHNDKRTEKMGEVEVIIGSSIPARTVKTHGDWVIAWDQTVEATVFVFPHRAGELQAYGKHIRQLFASFPANLHSRVILYDKAVRLRAAQRRDLLLTDHAKFSDLHVLWIQNAGAGSSTDGGERARRSSGGTSNRRRDACRRWNANKCPNSAGACNFAHVCSRCRSNTHTASECTTSQEAGSR